MDGYEDDLQSKNTQLVTRFLNNYVEIYILHRNRNRLKGIIFEIYSLPGAGRGFMI